MKENEERFLHYSSCLKIDMFTITNSKNFYRKPYQSVLIVGVSTDNLLQPDHADT